MIDDIEKTNNIENEINPETIENTDDKKDWETTDSIESDKDLGTNESTVNEKKSETTENSDVTDEEESENTSETTDNSNTSDTSSSATNDELLKQLAIINWAFDTLLVLLLGVLLNLYRTYRNRLSLLDTLNNTNLSEGLIDITNLPKISLAIFLYTTSTFVEINYSNYTDTLNVSPDKRDQQAINKAYITFFASLLIMIGTIIGGTNNLET